MLVLRNCRFVKELTEGYDQQFGDVLISDKFIEEIKPVGYAFPEGIEEIDVAGKTLLPGLFELHAHLYGFIYNPYELQCMSAGKIMFGAYDFAKAYLKAGYTTVRDCGSSYNSVAAVREAIDAGIVQGPRLIPCGLIITPSERGNETFNDLYYEADGPDEMRRACRKELQKGNDFIKLMVSGAFMNEGADPGVQIMEPEEIKAAVETTARKGTYVAAHCHGTSSIKDAIRAGVRTVEHGTFLDDEAIEMFKNSKDTYLVPTGAVGLYCLDESNSDVSAELLASSKAVADIEIENINKAYKAGLKLGFGSDIDLEAFRKIPGYEFIARKEYYTFEDVDILLQATKNSAEIIGMGDCLGTIKKGKLADLIVVDGKPDENICVMTKPLIAVMKEGKVISIE